MLWRHAEERAVRKGRAHGLVPLKGLWVHYCVSDGRNIHSLAAHRLQQTLFLTRTRARAIQISDKFVDHTDGLPRPEGRCTFA